MDSISYDSYKIDIESADPSKNLSMREVYGLEPAQMKEQINGGASLVWTGDSHRTVILIQQVIV